MQYIFFGIYYLVNLYDVFIKFKNLFVYYILETKLNTLDR